MSYDYASLSSITYSYLYSDITESLTILHVLSTTIQTLKSSSGTMIS